MLKWLADALVIIHFLWVIFMIGGVALTAVGLIIRPLLQAGGWRLLHLGGMLFAALLSMGGWLCPLTRWEYALRSAAGQPVGSNEGFVIRLANRLIFPDLDGRTLAALTVAAGVFVLVVFVFRPPRRVRRKGPRF